MSYNGSGTYVPPAGQPVATGTVIQSATFNTLVTDIGNTFNNVLPRDGQAPMQGQLKITDGTGTIPGIAFNSEASTGIYRPGTGLLALSVAGSESMRINGAGRVMIGTTTDDGTNTLQVNGPAKVSGAATLLSTLNVTGASTLASTLSVTGAASLASTLGVTGATSLSSVSTSGAATVGTTLNVIGSTTLSGGVGSTLNVTVPDAGARTTIAKFTHAGQRTLTLIGEYGGYDVGSTNGILLDIGNGSFGIGNSGSAPRLLFDTNGNLNVNGSQSGNSYKLFVNGYPSFGNTGSGFDVLDLNSTNGTTLRLQAAGNSSTVAIGSNGSQPLAFNTNNTERARFDTSGNFMVGRASAITATTDVGTFERNQNDIARLVVNNQNTGTSAQSMLDLEAYGAAWRMAVPSSTNNQNPLIFTTTGASGGEKMRLDYQGNLLLGATSALAKFTLGSGSTAAALADASVIGSFSTTPQFRYMFNHNGTGYLGIGSDGAGALIMGRASGGSGAVSSEYGRFDTSGNLLIGTTTSTGAKLVVSGTVQATSDASFGSVSVITAPSPGAYNNVVVSGDALYKGTSTSVPVTVAMHNGSSIRMSQSTIQFRTNNAATDSMQLDTNGNLGIGVNPTAKLDVGGGAPSTIQAVLTRGNSDNAFQLTARNGSGSAAYTEHARFGMEYVGSGMAAGFSFLRGGSQVDSSLALMTGNAERARLDSTGKLLIARTTDDGTGAKFQVNGAASVTGNLNVSSGNLYVTGQSMLGGATSTYTGMSSVLTMNYAGGGSMYGMALKPAASTGDTNAITFLTSGSTYASATAVGSIIHRASDAALSLSGTWQVNGNPIASTNAPTITNPTIVGYIEQFQSLNPGATVTINPGAGTLIEISITANTTITLPAATAGLGYTIIASYTGAYSLTFAGGTNLRWAGGAAPVATSVSGKSDKYVFTCGSGYTLAQDGGRSF